MSFEAASGDSSNLLTGVFIMLLLFVPVIMVYCIRSLTVVKPAPKLALVPEMTRFKKFRPKTVRLCTKHLIVLHTKGICLIDDNKCDVCSALKK